MTNEEAIKGLKKLRSFHNGSYGEHIDMAIKALEAQPCIEDYPTCTECEHYDSEKHYCPRFCQVIKDTLAEAQPCEDCISRAEVRRILGNEVFELTKLHTVNPEDNPKADAMAYGVNWSLNTLMELPSVTPQRPKGKWIHWTDDYKDYCTCSKCGYGEEGELLLKNTTPFCPYCGSYNGGKDDEISD